MCDTNKSFVDRGIFELMDRSLDSRKEWVFEHSIHPSINLSIIRSPITIGRCRMLSGSKMSLRLANKGEIWQTKRKTGRLRIVRFCILAEKEGFEPSRPVIFDLHP